MKRFILGIWFYIIFFIFFIPCISKPEDYLFYVKVDSGVSFSELANVVAVYPPWNPALQGYNATLGNCPIAGFSIGWEFLHILDLELNISHRSLFEYRQFQTPTTGGNSYTRQFDVSVTPILVYADILGRGIPYLHGNFGDHGVLYPIFGAALGMSNIAITNFRTTGLPATGDSSPYDSFSSENEYTLRKNLTYVFLIGAEYSYDNRWAIGTGYRWFNAGNFQGPEYLRASTGAAVDLGDDAWNMRLRTQEWFVELKIFI